MNSDTNPFSDVLIIGGGFAGLMAAISACRLGHSVRLVEASPRLGGVNNSIPWKGHALDLGCHLFANNDANTTQMLMELMPAGVHGVNARLASWTAGRLSLDLEYPDFSQHPLRCDIFSSLLDNAARKKHPLPPEASLKSLWIHRFGDPGAQALERALCALVRDQADALSADADPALPARRMMVCGQPLARLLKQLPQLDDCLLEVSGADPLRFAPSGTQAVPFRTFYPKGGGMGAFTRQVQDWLQEQAVDIRLGAQVQSLRASRDGVEVQLSDDDILTGQALIWTAAPGTLANLLQAHALAERLDKAVMKIPMVVVYFEVEPGSHTPTPCLDYVTCFAPDRLVYRVSSPTRWAPDVSPPGSAYIACEIPTEIGSPVWNSPQSHLARIWQEVCELGMVQGSQPSAWHSLKTPVSYSFPRVGLREALAELEETLAQTPRIVSAHPLPFAKSAQSQRIQALVERTMESAL